VPANWNPPRDQPHYDEDYATAVVEWKSGYEKWKTAPESTCEYWDWAGNPPEERYYRPKWTDAERTHFMMYETTSEGTPISPAFPSPEELAHWLTDNGASAFAGQTATYEEWLRVCRGGWAPSAVVIPGVGIQSGVAGLDQ
jgi:hypothetical protein